MWRSRSARRVWGELKINTFSSRFAFFVRSFILFSVAMLSMCVYRDMCVYPFSVVDSFLFLLHRISCYLLHFRINSVAVGLQFSFADWAHWAGANADVTAWKWVFRALKRTHFVHFVINIIKLKLIRKLFRRFLISGTLVRHRNERASTSVREILRYQQPDRGRK